MMANTNVMDLNMGLPEEYRAHRNKVLTAKREHLREVAVRRKLIPFEELKEINEKALEKRKQHLQEILPEGWLRVPSRSRPGEYVYENKYTSERQAWVPTEPAPNPAKPVDDAAKVMVCGELKSLTELKEKNKQALEARKRAGKPYLPEGWKQVESNSRPGEFVYENVYTEERISWYPTEPALKTPMPEQAIEALPDAENGRALYRYFAMTEEEMDLEPDDFVRVEVKSSNGWWVGVNVRTGKLGLFPGTFVEILPQKRVGLGASFFEEVPNKHTSV